MVGDSDTVLFRSIFHTFDFYLYIYIYIYLGNFILVRAFLKKRKKQNKNVIIGIEKIVQKKETRYTFVILL